MHTLRLPSDSADGGGRLPRHRPTSAQHHQQHQQHPHPHHQQQHHQQHHSTVTIGLGTARLSTGAGAGAWADLETASVGATARPRSARSNHSTQSAPSGRAAKSPPARPGVGLYPSRWAIPPSTSALLPVGDGALKTLSKRHPEILKGPDTTVDARDLELQHKRQCEEEFRRWREEKKASLSPTKKGSRVLSEFPSADELRAFLVADRAKRSREADQAFQIWAHAKEMQLANPKSPVPASTGAVKLPRTMVQVTDDDDLEFDYS